MSRTFIAICFILLPTIASFAQSKNIDRAYYPDTLSEKEITGINAASKNTTFYYLSEADSFSNIHDSIKAGTYLLKVSPFYFMFLKQTSTSIKTYISNRFHVTGDAEAKYAKYFNSFYKAKKSPFYIMFRKMAEEDIQLRNNLDTCMDSRSYAIIKDQLLNADSAHFSYLYNYFTKNGWPPLADGALYAGVIASHDFNHSDEYITAVKTAILNGNANMDILKSLIFWRAHQSDYKTAIQHYDNANFICFEVNSVFDNQLPISLYRIKQAIKEHCPSKVIMVIESHNMKKAYKWTDYMSKLNTNECVLSRLNVILSGYICSKKVNLIKGLEAGLWTVHFLPSDNNRLRALLYIIYDDDSIDYKFNKILTNKTFVTHTIHFDINKATIRQESLGYITDFANWLKSNPTVKLEIDGHTDNDGDIELNKQLSRERADEVKKQLIMRGVNKDRLTTKGYGASKPISSNATQEGKANNRRVEFIRQ